MHGSVLCDVPYSIVCQWLGSVLVSCPVCICESGKETRSPYIPYYNYAHIMQPHSPTFLFNWSLGGKLEVRGWDSLVPRLSPHPIFIVQCSLGQGESLRMRLGLGNLSKYNVYSWGQGRKIMCTLCPEHQVNCKILLHHEHSHFGYSKVETNLIWWSAND